MPALGTTRSSLSSSTPSTSSYLNASNIASYSKNAFPTDITHFTVVSYFNRAIIIKAPAVFDPAPTAARMNDRQEDSSE